MKTSPPCLQQVRARFHGFTILEILAVVAVIAILAAILIPVASRMQRGGQTSKSIQNLRQIHAQIMAFVGDHNGQLPRAVYDPGNDPNGLEDGFKHYWRRAIWESQLGPLGKTYAEQVANLTAGGYAKVMWCPVQVAKHKMSKTGFLEGHGSYAINKYVFLWKERMDEGVGDRRPANPDVQGRTEPLVVAGTSNGDLGTYPYFESTNPPVKGAYDRPPWFNMAYDYGSGGNSGLALFLDGRVELVTSEAGQAMNASVANDNDFK